MPPRRPGYGRLITMLKWWVWQSKSLLLHEHQTLAFVMHSQPAACSEEECQGCVHAFLPVRGFRKILPGVLQ
eukprot:scaffold314824_cov18-Tisochrysis_lutea.AAC.1